MSLSETKRHISALKHRKEFLEHRVATSDKDLSYDKGEVGALTEAISILETLLEHPYIYRDIQNAMENRSYNERKNK